jgi:hypothetical protein
MNSGESIRDQPIPTGSSIDRQTITLDRDVQPKAASGGGRARHGASKCPRTAQLPARAAPHTSM